MKKVFYAFCVLAAMYIGLNALEFKLNEPYRNRYSNPAYLNGTETVVQYNII